MDKKRKKSSRNISNQKYVLNKADITFSDVKCSICLNIMIDPVTMPCNHSLCLQCFKGNVSHTSLNCPICRKRISIWVRKFPKYEDLVNQELWAIIKEKFARKVQAALENREDSQEYSCVASPKISTPGEIRKEYEKELQSVNAELEAMKQKEHDASAIEITKIIEEEKTRVDKTKQDMEDICKRDLELAKEIRQNQVTEQISSITGTSKSLLFSPISRPKVTTLDRFFEKTPKQSIFSGSEAEKMTSTPKGYELDNRKYFPTRRRSLNKENYGLDNSDGSVSSMLNRSASILEERNFSGFLEQDAKGSASQSMTPISLYLSTSTENQSMATASALSVGLGNSNGEMFNNAADDRDSEENGMRAALPGTADEPSTPQLSEAFQQLGMREEELAAIIARQKSYDDRKRQQDEDRRMAFQLDKEWKLINRRKGTENEYSLRNTTPKRASSHARKRNRSCNQSTIQESFAKRRKPS